MPLVAAAVLPHGDFAFDPSLLSNPTSRAAADGLHRGSLLAGRLLADAAPDAIVLTTPHGLQTSWDVGIYQNAALQGVATVGRDLQESFGPASPRKLYPVSLDGQTDAGLAQQIMDVLSARHNVTLQRGWNGVLPMPLHWGEVLALSYVANASAAHCLPPLVTLGLPLSRYNLSSAVATGFLQLGRDLGRLLEASSKRATSPASSRARPFLEPSRNLLGTCPSVSTGRPPRLDRPRAHALEKHLLRLLAARGALRRRARHVGGAARRRRTAARLGRPRGPGLRRARFEELSRSLLGAPINLPIRSTRADGSASRCCTGRSRRRRRPR